MKICVLQHVPFEGPAAIAAWAADRGHELSIVHLYDEQPVRDVDFFNMLVVMGGPMGIYDVADHPWLEAERQFIRRAIDAGKAVLGVCLGAQQIAAALGAEVARNRHREIGWFPINSPQDVRPESKWADLFSEPTEVFHWHGDTFAIPEGAELLASSEACAHQAFVYDERVIALQFHLETTMESARLLIEHCADELDGSRFVQSAEQMLANPDRFQRLYPTLYQLLDRLASI